ncbi:hypothetical protein I3760_13G134000 [Carya illinoinensis]|nr:hypothetical protein I3760_13G134000 [Carya illinoinensis]
MVASSWSSLPCPVLDVHAYLFPSALLRAISNLSTIIREPCQQHQCCFLQFLRFLLMQDNTITLGCNESMKDLIWCINIVA